MMGSGNHRRYRRTRDLCRDSTEASSNLLKLSVTDGFFWRFEVPLVTVIGPLLDLRPLSCKPLPNSEFDLLREAVPIKASDFSDV